MRYSRFADFEKVRLNLSQIVEWAKASEYSATLPTGVIPGKRWRRNDGHFDPTCDDPGWLLCEYSEPFIGADGHERCKVLMKRAVIRTAAVSDRMYVVLGKKNVTRTIESIPSNERTGKEGLRFAAPIVEYCLETFGYAPERCFSMTYQPMGAADRHLPPVFILKFRNAKDALVFKMWFE